MFQTEEKRIRKCVELWTGMAELGNPQSVLHDESLGGRWALVWNELGILDRGQLLKNRATVTYEWSHGPESQGTWLNFPALLSFRLKHGLFSDSGTWILGQELTLDCSLWPSSGDWGHGTFILSTAFCWRKKFLTMDKECTPYIAPWSCICYIWWKDLAFLQCLEMKTQKVLSSYSSPVGPNRSRRQSLALMKQFNRRSSSLSKSLKLKPIPCCCRIIKNFLPQGCSGGLFSFKQVPEQLFLRNSLVPLFS